ncbi:MAG: YitT family protein [Bacteroidaceae bacterium]|nr:YitT family protein [Bacteroidaceae bacterium]
MKKSLVEYMGILLGCFLVSVAFVFFINPYKLVPGGVFGTSIVLHTLIPHIQVGTFGYIIGIPLLILSYFFLGKGIGAKTLLASLVTPFFMNVLSMIAYPSQQALRSLDPSLLAGGCIDLSNDLMLASILGPVIVGIGEGIIMRCGSTSGGSDIVAMLLHKYLRVKFSRALLAVDASVVLFGLLVIGMGLGSDGTGQHSWILSGYSLVCIYIASKTLGLVVSGTKNNKLIFIITKDKNRMRDFILEDMDRTATLLPSSGLYTLEQRDTLMMVVHMREVEDVTANLRLIDPDCFVVVTDAYDAYGERWSELPDKHDLKLS